MQSIKDDTFVCCADSTYLTMAPFERHLRMLHGQPIVWRLSNLEPAVTGEPSRFERYHTVAIGNRCNGQQVNSLMQPFIGLEYLEIGSVTVHSFPILVPHILFPSVVLKLTAQPDTSVWALLYEVYCQNRHARMSIQMTICGLQQLAKTCNIQGQKSLSVDA